MRRDNKRNYGIDILRCVSMLMVVILHLLSHGGILVNVQIGSFRYVMLSLLEVITYSAVDIFALISGYIMVTKKYESKKIIFLWCQVFFYSLIILVMALGINTTTFSMKGILKSLFPVLFCEYWYFTSYFAMFFFIPYMNYLLTGRYAGKLVLLCFIIFSFLPTIVTQDPFVTKYGYSPLWLAVCYFIGGYLKLNEERIKGNITRYLQLSLVIIIFLWLSKIGIQLIARKVGVSVSYGYYFLSYTSPLVLLLACCMILCMSKVNIKNDILMRIISKLSLGAFAVYLIHDNYFVREIFVNDKFVFLNQLNPVIEIIMILLIALGVFILGVCIDCFRQKVFQICRIEKGINYAVPKISEIVLKCFERIKIVGESHK